MGIDRSGKLQGLDALTIARAVEASVILLVADRSLVAAVSRGIARRDVEFDRPTRASLYESFVDVGCAPDDDVMLILSDGLTHTSS